MTKHIVGLILFTFIVGTAAIVSGLFGNTPISKKYTVVKINDKYRVYKKKKRKKRCRKKRRHHHSPKLEATVTQALFDNSSNKFITNLKFKNDRYFERDVDLHFFVKDRHGERYIKTETIVASSGKQQYVNSFKWMKNFGSRENLYVIPTAKTLKDGWTIPPSFNVDKATPVILKR